MSLIGFKTSNSQLRYLVASLLCIRSTQAASVYVRVNETSKITLAGSWQPIDALGSFSDHWLIGTHDPNSATPTTLSFAFDGTGFAALGTVVNGTNGQGLNLSATMDGDDLPPPTYSATPNLSNGLDPNSQLFTNGSLTPQLHNFVLTITGETSPFYIQGLAYTPTDHSQSQSSSTSMGPSVSTTASSQQQSNKSNDAVKLGGAIGGGVGALLLVALIIFYMMRRMRRIEKDEKSLQARPFVAGQIRSARPSITGGYASSVPTTAVGSAIRSKKEKETPSQTASIPSTERERAREKRPLPSSSHSQSNSVHGSQVNSPPPRNRSTTTPQRSPAPSIISVPSDYQATTVGLPGGTAVASSYIGPSPLPQEDIPPVPPMPGDVKRKSSRKSRREKERGKDPLPAPSAPTPASGLGLFSNDSTNSIGTQGPLTRPLPIVPGSRSSAAKFQFPPEKMGLPTPPPAPPRWHPDQKRPLPPPS